MAAYEELVRRYQGIAHRTAFLVAGAADADDAVQVAFVKAYAALGRFDPERPFKPWLLRIVTNEAKNRRRSEARRAVWELQSFEDRSRERTVPTPEAETLAWERRRVLLDAVNTLPPRDRLVIAYRYFLGLSEEDAAEALEVARGTVKSRLSRAIARLRESLADAGIEEVRVEGE